MFGGGFFIYKIMLLLYDFGNGCFDIINSISVKYWLEYNIFYEVLYV